VDIGVVLSVVLLENVQDGRGFLGGSGVIQIGKGFSVHLLVQSGKLLAEAGQVEIV
jgi:hypothetical protein